MAERAEFIMILPKTKGFIIARYNVDSETKENCIIRHPPKLQKFIILN